MKKSILPIMARREAKGLTRDQLAKKAKVTTGYLSSAENGKAGVSQEVAERICKTLGMRITEDARETHNKTVKAYVSGLPSSQPKKASAPAKASPKAIQAVPAPKSAPKAPKAAKDLSGQYSLPGFAELINAEIRLQVQDMVRAALQRGQTAQAEVETEDESSVKPTWSKKA